MQLGDATAVGAALDTLRSDLQHLVKLVEDHGLDAYDDPGLVGFMHKFEQVRNQLPLVDHQVLRDAGRLPAAEQPGQGCGAALCYPSAMATWPATCAR